MLDVALLSVIRRWYFREGLSKREIARRTGLSRNTLKKYLSQEQVEPAYPQRACVSKLDAFETLLTEALEREVKKPRKQRKTVKQLYHELVPQGYTGSYDRVAAFARLWRQQQSVRKQVYVPLQFAPGEAFQFDWGENWVSIGGKKVKVQVAHFKLCHSKVSYQRAYWTQTHEMLFDAHTQAFRVFGGVPERGIYDNMKTAVDKIGRGKERVVNKRFQAMASHYLFEADFCNPAAGWEKGQVEKAVQDGRYALWHKAPGFNSLEALNDWLEQECQSMWQQQLHPEFKPHTLWQCLQDERLHLMHINSAFDGFIEHSKQVSSTCLVTFENNKYSVPASFANRRVSLRVYPAALHIIAEGRKVTEHLRVFTRDHNAPGQVLYNWRHYLLVAQRKPGALRNGAPFQTLPESFKQLQQVLLRNIGGDRQMADVLALVLHHDAELVEQAITQALQSGCASKDHVINCLHRLMETPPPEPVPVAAHLQLSIEPLSDTSRYEQLGGGYAH